MFKLMDLTKKLITVLKATFRLSAIWTYEYNIIQLLTNEALDMM